MLIQLCAEDHCSSGSVVEFIFNLPPSTNKLYQRRQGGGVALTKFAKSYAEHVKMIVSCNIHKLSGFPINTDTVYSFDITLVLAALENPGWFKQYSRGKHQGERKAKTRYKKIDVDNRVKFVQDCVVKAIGIPDDSQIFEGTQRKAQGPKEGVIVTIQEALLTGFLKPVVIR